MQGRKEGFKRQIKKEGVLYSGRAQRLLESLACSGKTQQVQRIIFNGICILNHMSISAGTLINRIL